MDEHIASDADPRIGRLRYIVQMSTMHPLVTGSKSDITVADEAQGYADLTSLSEQIATLTRERDVEIEPVKEKQNSPWCFLDGIHEELDHLADALSSQAEQIATLTRERDDWRDTVKDTTEEEEICRELLKPYLTDFEINGDSYVAPGMIQWIESLIGKLDAMRHERDKVLQSVFDIQKKHYGDATGLHMAMIEWVSMHAALTQPEKELGGENGQWKSIRYRGCFCRT